MTIESRIDQLRESVAVVSKKLEDYSERLTAKLENHSERLARLKANSSFWKILSLLAAENFRNKL